MISSLFTSLERLRAGSNVATVAAGASTSFDADLLSCGMAASAMMQGYMSRGIRIESRTETYRVPPSGIIFLRASPVVSVASVTIPDGSSSSRSLPFWVCDTNEVHITSPVDRLTPVEITYMGGLGAGRNRFAVSASSITGTVAPGSVTAPGGASGKIVSWGEKSLVAIIETTAGVIESGTVVTGSGFSFMVVDSAQEVDLSGARDLQKACEQQSIYMYQRRNSLGRSATTMGGTTTFESDYDLLPGVERILGIYSPPMAF